MKKYSKIKDKLNKILSHHTGQPLEKVEKDTDRDFYLSAKDAKDYGIIDEVSFYPFELGSFTTSHSSFFE